MDPTSDAHQNLDDISTYWPDLQQAHAGSADAIQLAQQTILQRYGQAIYRYLRGALGNGDDADEVYQEFALRFVRGDFRRANPERGSFRRYLKRALSNLVNDHRRKKLLPGVTAPDNIPDPAGDDPQLAEIDAAFLADWRAELIGRSWAALQRIEKSNGQPLYTVLRARSDHPAEPSAKLAERLSPILGKEVTADWVRNRLHVARDKFTELLLGEVSASLHEPTLDNLEQELADLGMLEHCRPALDKRRGGA